MKTQSNSQKIACQVAERWLCGCRHLSVSVLVHRFLLSFQFMGSSSAHAHLASTGLAQGVDCFLRAALCGFGVGGCSLFKFTRVALGLRALLG